MGEKEMNRMQQEKKLVAMAKELAKGLKTEQDLSMLSRALWRRCYELNFVGIAQILSPLIRLDVVNIPLSRDTRKSSEKACPVGLFIAQPEFNTPPLGALLNISRFGFAKLFSKAF